MSAFNFYELEARNRTKERSGLIPNVLCIRKMAGVVVGNALNPSRIARLGPEAQCCQEEADIGDASSKRVRFALFRSSLKNMMIFVNGRTAPCGVCDDCVHIRRKGR